jgi:thymidylate synthase (FAD)
MRLINSSVEILDQINGEEVLKKLERIARTCYKSEGRITEDDSSARKLLTNIVKSGHEAMIEHYSFSVKFICSRAISHELVRHRMASFAQESQRYVNYTKDMGVTFIIPERLHDTLKPWTGYYNIIDLGVPGAFKLISEDFPDPHNSEFVKALAMAEEMYLDAIHIEGVKPQDARDVLPNATKTEVIMTANLREWRHFFNLRCDRAAHPDMRKLALNLLRQVHALIPVIFDDLYDKFIKVIE